MSRDSAGPDQLLAKGLERHRQGDLPAAAALYEEVLKQSLDHAGAQHYLGVIAHQRGDSRKAERLIKASLRNTPADAYAHNNLGEVLRSLGRYEEALRCYEQALSLKKGYVDALGNLGLCLFESGRLEEAVTRFQELLSSSPGRAETYVNLGHVYRALRRWGEAERQYRSALTIDGENPEILTALGQTLLEQSKLEEARHQLERVIELQPEHAGAHNLIGDTLLLAGDVHTALTHLESSLSLDPRQASAWRNLSSAKRFGGGDAAFVEQLAGLIESLEPDDTDKATLEFSLGKMLDDCGRYEDAWAAYRSANALRARTAKYNPDRQLQMVERLIEAFSKERVTRGLAGAHPSERPVFIIGMPRSGTTLVEQILASHPDIHGAGELAFFDSLRGADGGSYLDTLDQLDPTSVDAIARRYLSALSKAAGECTRITDKMLSNYLHIGLIGMLFPNVRFVHCHRNPLDTCLSIFFHDFSRGMNFSWRLLDIGFHYRLYEGLMRHWQRVFGGRIFELGYETLIEDQERHSRDLIDYCGLDWDQRCLRFYEHHRAVFTASRWQVRQPVYTSAVARFEHYRPHLDELRAALAGENIPGSC